MGWYIWMDGGRPHLGFGSNLEKAKENDVSKHSVDTPVSPADENWLRCEIEKLEQERRNLGISHEET